MYESFVEPITAVSLEQYPAFLLSLGCHKDYIYVTKKKSLESLLSHYTFFRVEYGNLGMSPP